jgi:hypothetical protein
MTDIGIQTDELYINGMTLREFLLLDIPQTHYLKMLDNTENIDTNIPPTNDNNHNNNHNHTDTDTDTDNDDNVFTNEEANALYEAIFDYIDYIVMSNISSFSDPQFHKKVELGVYEFLELAFSDMCGVDLFTITYDMEMELECIVETCIEDYFTGIVPPRSYSTSFIQKIYDTKSIEKNIEYLRSIPQHQQRTPEWYKRRNEMITASSAWKVFKSDSNINQLIYEKCNAAAAVALPTISSTPGPAPESESVSSDENDSKDETISPSVSEIVSTPASAPAPVTAKAAYVNVNSPLHWGQKYEEISRMIYESRNNTKVGEFGCIPHSDYPFLGASPDGINIDPSSPLYGRMLEIKNIVNREIDGVPLEEYWIQMQLQMQVCKCTECDFLETRFKEYADEEEFLKDSASDFDNEFHLTAARTLKGVFSYFIKDGGTPVYHYAPLYLTRKEYDKWCEEIIDKNTDLVWIKNIYWYLHQYSCVLVLRNDVWFQNAIPQIEKVWNIIVKERESGYEHRAPKKRASPGSASASVSVSELLTSSKTKNTSNIQKPNNGCLIMISDLELNL